jgi:hypothetical protein
MTIRRGSLESKDGMWTASLVMVNTGERVVGSNRPALSICIGG